MNLNRDDSRVQLPPFGPMIMERMQNRQILPHEQPAFSSQPLSEIQMKKNGGHRVRVKKACKRCKKQKTKCDGEIPCATCSRVHHHCEYTNTSTSLTAQIPQLDQIGPRVDKRNEDYVTYLENRVTQLERSIQRKDLNHFGAKEIFDKNMYTFSKDKYRVMRRYQNIVPSELAYSVFNTLNEEELDELVIPRIQFYGWNMNGGHYLQQRTLPDMIHLIDLSRELEFANWLLDFFMLKINPLFSIIHEKVFRDQYENYVLKLKSESDQSTRLFSAILYLVFAISLRYAENDPEVPQAVKTKIVPDLEEKLFDSAHEVVNKLSFEWQSFELIQSWVLITFYLRTTSRQNSSYMSLGTAIRMCKGMALNLDMIPEALTKKPYEKTKSNRIFWLVYMWDSLHGFQSGKGQEISHEDIVKPFPELDLPIEDDWLSKPALAMLHLSKIASKIQDYNKNHYKIDTEFLAVINEELQNWKEWFDENSEGYDQLLINQVYFTYHDIVLSFNNKALLRLVDKKYYADEGDLQFQLLIKHSSEVVELFQDISYRGQLLIPWCLNLALLFNVSLVSVTFINAGLHFSQCSQNFTVSLGLLETLEGKAHMAKECIWALKMLNRMCVARMEKSIEALTRIGIDHGPDEVNRVKYLQFGKVEDQSTNKKRKRDIENSEGDDLNDFNLEGLLGNLKWFDQWVQEFE